MVKDVIPNALMESFLKQEETTFEGQERGGELKGRPESIALHMPSYALLWKLGFGISPKMIQETEEGTVGQPTSFGQGMLSYADRELSTTDLFNQDVIDKLDLGEIVAYITNQWRSETGSKKGEDTPMIVAEYVEESQGGKFWDYEKEKMVGEGIDTIFMKPPAMRLDAWRSDFPGDLSEEDKNTIIYQSMSRFAGTALHEPIHMNTTISHPSVSQAAFSEQTDMMQYSAKLVLDEWNKKHGTSLDYHSLMQQFLEGDDITELIPDDIFDVSLMDLAKNKLEEFPDSESGDFDVAQYSEEYESYDDFLESPFVEKNMLQKIIKWQDSKNKEMSNNFFFTARGLDRLGERIEDNLTKIENTDREIDEIMVDYDKIFTALEDFGSELTSDVYDFRPGESSKLEKHIRQIWNSTVAHKIMGKLTEMKREKRFGIETQHLSKVMGVLNLGESAAGIPLNPLEKVKEALTSMGMTPRDIERLNLDDSAPQYPGDAEPVEGKIMDFFKGVF